MNISKVRTGAALLGASGLLVLLSACGGGSGGGVTIGGGGGNGGGGGGGGATSFGLLKPAESGEELARSLHTGLQGAAYVSDATMEFDWLFDNDFSGAPVLNSPTFSRTNLQEAGVDEADIVKYDGEVLYVAESQMRNWWPWDMVPFSAVTDTESAVSMIHLFRTDPAEPSAQAVAQLELGAPEFSIEGLYLDASNAARQLIAVGKTHSFLYWEAFASDYYWREGRTLVRSWNVTDADNPAADWTLELDGTLLASRRIERTLYLVTRYSPVIEGLVAYPQTAADAAANRSLIEEAPLPSLLPDIRRDGGQPAELLAPTDCFVPNAGYDELPVPAAGGSLVTITAIDLDAPDNPRSICLNTYASGFYVSTSALYVTGSTDFDATLIHKVAFTDSGPQYRGSGVVPGYIGTSNPAYLMSEKEGDLRVVSSLWDDRFFPPVPVAPQPGLEAAEDDPGYGRHRLTILRESSDGARLQQVARLPNASRPQPIGKPGEDIYATRFLGDRAYVVTFEIIDPLYVLDLSIPNDPRITGELEIPGFSTVLQPLGDNLLLGIGMDVPADAQGAAQGVKLALFDVGDINAPASLAEVVIGKRGSHSPALDNYHAFTLLEVDGRYRVAVPIQRHARLQPQGLPESNPWYYYGWSDSGLYLFDIDPGAGSLQLRGSLILEEHQSQEYSLVDLYNSRSVLHDDAVFLVNGSSITTRHW